LQAAGFERTKSQEILNELFQALSAGLHIAQDLSLAGAQGTQFLAVQEIDVSVQDGQRRLEIVGSRAEGVCSALESLPQILVFLKQVLRARYISVRSGGSSSWHRFWDPSRVRNTPVLVDSGHEENHRFMRGEGESHRLVRAQVQYKNRMSGAIRCQRKMHENYPSVAKGCTFERFGVGQANF
jgi:hypothetical protein